mmetsp:Transcript_90177/g.280754  ORF Transcript_90177/g.280754 Transcript_90177/m.280754 type:complete len:382 (+) Transcript_90177:222-1367(+)
MDAKLAARADVLHREGAVPHNGHVQALQLVVVNLVEHGVAYVPAKGVLALVGLLPGQREIAGEHADAGGMELLLGSLVVVLLRHELPVLEPSSGHILGRQLVPDDLEGLRPREGAVVRDDGHLLDVGVELDVGHDPLLLDGHLEHVEERVARGPRGREAGGNGVVLTEREVVRSVLRLQLGSGVGLVHPGGTTDPAHPIEDDKVQLLPLVEEHRHAKAEVPCSDDHLGVLVLVGLAREGGDALHHHLPLHLLVRVHLPDQCPAPLDELDLVRVDGQLERQHLGELQDARAGHARNRLLLAGRADLQGHADPCLALLPRLLALDDLIPVLVVGHGCRALLLARPDGGEALLPRQARLLDVNRQGPVGVVLQVLGPLRIEVQR